MDILIRKRICALGMEKLFYLCSKVVLIYKLAIPPLFLRLADFFLDQISFALKIGDLNIELNEKIFASMKMSNLFYKAEDNLKNLKLNLVTELEKCCHMSFFFLDKFLERILEFLSKWGKFSSQRRSSRMIPS